MAVLAHRHLPAGRIATDAAQQVLWFAAGAAGAFLVPFLFSDRLELDANLYYLIYFAAVGSFLGFYAWATAVDVGKLVRARWLWSLAIGGLASAFLIANVMGDDSTARPSGLEFAWAIAWRGVMYGIVDALLLSAFPAVVAWTMLGRNLHGWGRRVEFGVLAFVLMFTITATYHLGYPQYRDDGMKREGLGGPEIGNTVISLPSILTLNPVGSMVAHVSMHVTSVVHAYETEIFLPPQTMAD